MKAVVYTKYGSPDVLQIEEVAKPTPAAKKISMLMPKENSTDLGAVKNLLEVGTVVPVIDRRYTLSEVPEAIGYLEEGHARGKVIITI